MAVTHQITLDIDKNRVRLDQDVHVRVGDVSSQTVACSLTKGGAAYTPASGTTAKLEILKPDNTWTRTDATISGSIVSGVIPSAALTAEGECKRAYFRLISGSAEDTTEDFRLTVYGAAVYDEQAESLPYDDAWEAIAEQAREEIQQELAGGTIPLGYLQDAGKTWGQELHFVTYISDPSRYSVNDTLATFPVEVKAGDIVSWTGPSSASYNMIYSSDIDKLLEKWRRLNSGQNWGSGSGTTPSGYNKLVQRTVSSDGYIVILAHYDNHAEIAAGDALESCITIWRTWDDGAVIEDEYERIELNDWRIMTPSAGDENTVWKTGVFWLPKGTVIKFDKFAGFPFKFGVVSGKYPASGIYWWNWIDSTAVGYGMSGDASGFMWADQYITEEDGYVAVFAQHFTPTTVVSEIPVPPGSIYILKKRDGSEQPFDARTLINVCLGDNGKWFEGHKAASYVRYRFTGTLLLKRDDGYNCKTNPEYGTFNGTTAHQYTMDEFYDRMESLSSSYVYTDGSGVKWAVLPRFNSLVYDFEENDVKVLPWSSIPYWNVEPLMAYATGQVLPEGRIGAQYVRDTMKVGVDESVIQQVRNEYAAGDQVNAAAIQTLREDVERGDFPVTGIDYTDIVYNNYDVKTKLNSARKRRNLTAGGSPNDNYDGHTTHPPILTLLHCSDVHERPSTAVKNLGRIARFRNQYPALIDDWICTGDLITYEHWGMQHYEDSTDQSLLLLNGNHDLEQTGRTSSLSVPQGYQMLIEPYYSNWGEVTIVPNRTWYYKDYAASGIRMVCLDTTIQHGHLTDYQTEEQLWLREVLSDALENNLSVLMAQHYPPRRAVALQNGWNEEADWWSQYAPRTFYMPDVFLDELETFMNNGGDFICWICGHVHREMMAFDSNYPRQLFLTVPNASFEMAYSDLPRIEGDKSQDCFNMLSFDTYTKRVKVIRVGAGLSDSFDVRDTLIYDWANRRVI